jgi:hypothetical protein
MEGGDARPQILGKFKVEYLFILHKVSSMVSTSMSNGNVENQLTKLLLWQVCLGRKQGNFHSGHLNDTSMRSRVIVTRLVKGSYSNPSAHML